MSRSAVESFLRTLILGDFEENQNFAGQIVGGLISLIPVLDQVLDARDISGAIYRINKQGGFSHATTDQIVNLGFAAFGAIPEVGSAFKTVFKPLWKERRAARGAVNGGLQAVERLLGMRKGGAITWIRKELLGQWVPRTNQAIVQVNLAMDACIELLDFIANASGWKDWLIPDPIQALAKEMLPPLRRMKSGVSAAMQRASAEVKAFLEDLLGEQAAAVVMATGRVAVQASAIPGSRTRQGHNAAAMHPQGRELPRQSDRRTGARHTQDATPGAGRMAATVRVTARTIKEMASREKGLVGEHMADYFELKRLGGNWPHDKLSGTWSPATVHKLNVDRRPVNLRLVDLPKVNHSGLDAVWEHGGRYTVTEAKARGSIGSAYGIGKMLVKQGKIPDIKGLTPDQELLHYLLSDYEDKGGSGGGMMQMGRGWCADRAQREGLDGRAANAVRYDLCERRVVLVSFEAGGALDHAEALMDIHAGKADAAIHAHVGHGATRVWEKATIDAVERARRTARAHQPDSSPQPSGSKKKRNK